MIFCLQRDLKMNKIVSKLFLVGILGLSNLNASEMLFDLRAQDYSNTLTNNSIMSKYKINDNVILETNINKSSEGFYHIENLFTKGVLALNIKSPITNWKYNLDIEYTGFSTEKRVIVFSDKIGENITMEFYPDGFTINAKEYKAEIAKQHLIINITKDLNNFTVTINGQKVHTSQVKFGILKSVTADILKQNLNIFDKLNNIILVSND